MAGALGRYAVGIDLGTTNTVIASALLESDDEARVFDVPQLVSGREVEARALLSSTLYAPFDGELTDDPFGDAPWIIGEQARRRGAEVAGRLVASSKSWLVHGAVDRTAAILPWGSEGGPKLSPLDAAARLLVHVRRAWDVRHPLSPLAQQDVVLTVPASFDDVARELTVEAARSAGLSPKLLEEPQAAFYDWLARAGRDGLRRLTARTGGDTVVLVVDVGGGTTDLSLLRVVDAEHVTRTAVGPHLLLGGDNMDLALAHACEPRLAPAGSPLDATSFSQLVSACRAAKEMLLGSPALDDAPVTLLGRGGDLVGGSRRTRLSRQEVERIVLDGFFPAVLPDATPVRARGALVAFGLPYERDVAITRHIAAFLARHRANPSSVAGADSPNALLLNGGVFHAERIAERLVETLAGWRGGSIHRLADADPDVAVARGAVAYARARLGRGQRIAGGIARGYFVRVASPDAPARAVCVVPRGADEGVSHVAPGRVFGLAVGRPVRFDLLASAEVDARPGDLVDVDDDRFASLPPLTATIGAGSGDLRVTIEGELTPVGTLDLACVEVAGSSTAPRRFRLAFQLREPSHRAEPGDAERASVTRPRPESQTVRRLEPAIDAIERAFGRSRAEATGREAKDLLRELERSLGERQQWTMETNRALFDALFPNARGRRRSADHERVFWLLAGWCIRPGLGDALDAGRIAGLSPLFDERLSFPAEARSWQQFWIAWRRAAPGLDEATQLKIRDFADAHLAPAESMAKRPKKPALALDDALDLAASLERLPVERRVQLGGWVLERTWTDRDPRLWSAVGRIGSRVPAYASVHHVSPPHAAERWLDHLLREKWAAVPTAAEAAVRLARRTGDRARDIAEGVRREVEQRLVASGASEAWLRAVREIVPVQESERVAFFGDALPPGLRLVD